MDKTPGQVLSGQPAKDGQTKDLKLDNADPLSNVWGAPLKPAAPPLDGMNAPPSIPVTALPFEFRALFEAIAIRSHLH